jgi:hypothetical protein
VEELMSAVLKAELSLSAIAARSRLTKAESALRDFWMQHGGTAPSPELQAAWERERAVLEVEKDEAERYLRKSEADLHEANRGSTHADATQKSTIFARSIEPYHK